MRGNVCYKDQTLTYQIPVSIELIKDIKLCVYVIDAEEELVRVLTEEFREDLLKWIKDLKK